MIGQLSKEEVNRKLLHIIAVVLPASIFYGPIYYDLTRFFMVGSIFLLLTFSIIIELFRFKIRSFGAWFTSTFGSMMRVDEKKQLTGATYVLAGSAICSLLSTYSEDIAVTAFISLTLFILGDAVAAIVGKAIGRIRVGEKTLEGALGCFVFCAIVAGLVFPQLPCFVKYWGSDISTPEIIIIAATVSILEFFPFKFGRLVLNDNLYVPVVTTLVISLVHL
jgi:dolichol kinase